MFSTANIWRAPRHHRCLRVPSPLRESLVSHALKLGATLKSEKHLIGPIRIPRPVSRPARSLALPGRASPGSGSILGPKSSATLTGQEPRQMPPRDSHLPRISHDGPFPGRILLLVTGLVEYLETPQLASHFQEGHGLRQRSGLGSSPGASAAPPPPSGSVAA